MLDSEMSSVMRVVGICMCADRRHLWLININLEGIQLPINWD